MFKVGDKVTRINSNHEENGDVIIGENFIVSKIKSNRYIELEGIINVYLFDARYFKLYQEEEYTYQIY